VNQSAPNASAVRGPLYVREDNTNVSPETRFVRIGVTYAFAIRYILCICLRAPKLQPWARRSVNRDRCVKHAGSYSARVLRIG